MQDNHDVWNNSMDLAGLKNGCIIGFKYFGFGGLTQSTKGLPAFEGAKNGTELCLNLTPNGKNACRVKVMLDGPVNNNVWNGKEIGVIDIPANGPRGAQTFRVKVPAVEGLTGKHAIYLVAEGPEIQKKEQRPQWGRPRQPQRPEGLFDLHGIGFGKNGANAKPDLVPMVSIIADGQELTIPRDPIRSTNANGYTDLTRYQVYAPLKADSKLEATTTHPKDVHIVVSPVVDGRATVKATYKGKEKIFLIN